MAARTRDEIARQVAKRLAGEVGPKLPVYVERLIELGDDATDEASPLRRGIDNATVIAVASLLMQAIGIVLTVIHRREDEQRRLAEEQRRQALEREVRAGITFPEAVPPKVRTALVEVAVDEGMKG